MELKRIGVLSLAKINTIMMAVFGLLLGLFIALVNVIVPSAEGDTLSDLGIFIVIILPILYAVMGFVFGALSAIFYNFIAKWFGGIEFEVAKPVQKLKK